MVRFLNTRDKPFFVGFGLAEISTHKMLTWLKSSASTPPKVKVLVELIAESTMCTMGSGVSVRVCRNVG